MIGIGGISYGGYATLLGLTRNPELFEFGIYMNGTTDLIEQIEHWRRENKFWAYKKWVEYAGDPNDPEEAKALKEASPLYYLENIDDPVFLYYGLDDHIIPFENQKNLTRLLKHHGKKFERLYQREEGHNPFADVEHRIELAEELQKFLNIQLQRIHQK
jgi:dipeptidyl aminopeptidase/acylaminoacyl peptidase